MSLRVVESRNESNGVSTMSAREIQNHKATARGIVVQQAAHAREAASKSPPQGAPSWPSTNGVTYTLESAGDEVSGALSLPMMQLNAADLMLALRHLEAIAKRQVPRIAFRAKGSILVLDLADIFAVQAEGNYVSLRHQRKPYLVRESLSCIAETLKPYGFIRIHRSVIVNIALVEEVQPLPTGEYRLRVKGWAGILGNP